MIGDILADKGNELQCCNPPLPHTRQEKNHAHFPGKNLFRSLQHGSTLFSPIKPRLYYISILKLIYVYYSAI